MAEQDQNLNNNQVENSQVQLGQSGRDTVSFQNSRDNRVTIENVLLKFIKPNPPQVNWDWAMRLLREKQLPQICKRLTDTLGRERQMMSVDIEEQMGLVGRPSLEPRRVLDIEGKAEETLDPNKLLIETFGRDDIARKLLIVGAPGSGKTTVLLSLAEQLVRGALDEPKTVIPVLFELSTWRNDNQTIRDWLIEQLYEQHGGKRKDKLYEQWLDQQVLLPLMDGLDELGLTRQKKCTEKLQAFAGQYPHLVVCCRIKEFTQAGIKLNSLNGAIRLASLTDQQIQSFLTEQQSPLWSVIQTNPRLKQLLEPTPAGDPGLLRIPLFISLAARVYDPKQPFATKKDLLDRYIEGQLSKDLRDYERRNKLIKKNWAYPTLGKEPSRQKTQRTLSWIARQLQQRNQVELLIEKIQSDWLETKQLKRRYRLIGGLIVGLIVGLIFGLIGGLIFGLIGGLIFGLIVGLIVGLIGGLIVGLIFGLILGLILGLKQDLQLRSRPNQGIWNSLQSFFWTTLISYPFGILFAGLGIIPSTVSEGITEGKSLISILSSVGQTFPDLLIPGIFGAIFFGFLAGGGMACIQHLCLRWVLWQSGLAPWNLAQFLNYCVERRLLQRVGGSYRFLHRELLDHFAKL